MPTQPPSAPRGSPVPGVIPEPVHVVEDTGGGNAGRPPAPRRRHPITQLLSGLLSVIRGDKHVADAAAPSPPAPDEVAPRDPRGPRTGSQAKEG